MTTAEDILSFIECEPDSDTARLAYADFLDEEAREPTPRGELIRLQVELERRFPGLVRQPKDAEWSEHPHAVLCRCESELLTQHAAEFRRGPKCEKCGGKKGKPLGETSWIDCRDCRHTGDAGGLMRIVTDDVSPREGEWRHKVEWHRGFPRVFCRMEECVQQREKVIPGVLSFGPTYETVPTDWLLSVVRHHRGVEVWVTDKEPWPSTMKRGKYLWFADDDNSARNSSEIHGFLFDAMPGHPIPFSRLNRSHKEFDSKELAQVALARAIPAWARGHLAGAAIAPVGGT